MGSNVTKPVPGAKGSAGPPATKPDKHHEYVIVGGGTAGITVAARLRRAMGSVDMAVIEPSSTHYYQPLWTLVGGGVYDKTVTARPEADYIPKGATWIQDAVAAFDPDHSTLTTSKGLTIGYRYLVVAAGIQIDWDKVKGLKESLGHDGVCTNYAFDYVDTT